MVYRVNISVCQEDQARDWGIREKNRFIHFMRAEVVSSSIWVFRWVMSWYFTSEWLT